VREGVAAELLFPFSFFLFPFSFFLMTMEIDEQTRRFVTERRVARLATADINGQPAVVPVCYVFDGENIYSALDEKPKRVAHRKLKRVRNIQANPKVSMVIDDYSEDWSSLAFVVITGLASIIEPEGEEHRRAVLLLREKYPQYRQMNIDKLPMIKIMPLRVRRWAAGG
jgi:PPOX class probable F420-dependent enzyme